MESPNLNPLPERDAELEAHLRQPEPPLADDGFSARVVAALPSKPPRNRERLWTCTAGAVLGTIFAIARGASWSALVAGGRAVEQSLAELASLAADPWFLVSLVAVALSLLYVFRRDAPDSVRP